MSRLLFPEMTILFTMKLLLIIFHLCLFSWIMPIFGQKLVKCGTAAYNIELQKSHPELRKTRMEMESFSKKFTETATDNALNDTIIIPVVVHILAPAIGAPENIRKEQVYSQIISLNEDFSRIITEYGQEFPPFWKDAYSGDTRIRFCLAQYDPNGKPTSGITRTMTAVTAFDRFTNEIKFDEMGGKDIWPPDEYLNVWVGNLEDVLGYAQYPGGPVLTDGVAIDYTAFGTVGTATAPFALGRTLVHEVGHWLNLYHVWGPEVPPYTAADPTCQMDDEVQDTPLQEVPNFGCGAYTFSCDGSRDMLENFMNYSYDACNNFFSRGQVRRMRAVLAEGGYRYKLTFSEKGCRDISWREDE